MKKLKYISAGAGSGKTTKLIKILVDNISQGVKPSQVMMTTYTVAAANEIKERARRKLLELGMVQEAGELESAMIGTVDSICLRYIQKYWYLLGISPDIRQLDDEDMKVFQSEQFAGMVSPADAQTFEEYRALNNITHFEDGASYVPYYDYWQDYIKNLADKAIAYECTSQTCLDESKEKSKDYIYSLYPYEFNGIKAESNTGGRLLKPLPDSIADISSQCFSLYDELVTKLIAVDTDGRTNKAWPPLKSDVPSLNRTFSASIPDVKDLYDVVYTDGAFGDKINNFKSLSHLYEMLKSIADKLAEKAATSQNTANSKKKPDTKAKYQKEADDYKAQSDDIRFLLNTINQQYNDIKDYVAKLCKSTIFSNKILPIIDLVFSYTKQWLSIYQDYKTTHKMLDYADYESMFYQLLTNEDVVKQDIQDNIKLVMVDEFQDVSPFQYRMFNEISDLVGDKTELDYSSYWVGDPKQAIYGFRGSDIELVNTIATEIKDSIKNGNPNDLAVDYLTDSHRSRKALVDFTNNLFKSVFPELDYDTEVKLNHGRSDSKMEVPNNLPVVARCNVGGSKSMDYESLASKIRAVKASSRTIQLPGTGDSVPVPMRWKDIAVLCRTNSDVKKISDALVKQNVPVAVCEKELTSRAEVQLMISLLYLVKSSHEKHAVADILKLMKDMSTEVILKDYLTFLKGNGGKSNKWMDDDNFIKDVLCRLQKVQLLSVSDIVDAIIYEFRLNDFVQKWGQAPVRRRNLAEVQNIARHYEAHCQNMELGATLSGFIPYLRAYEPEMNLDNESDSVKVLTYHKSKGLEWPVVFLTSLEYDALSETNFMKYNYWGAKEIRKTDREDQYWIQFNPEIKDYIFDDIKAQGFYTSVSKSVQKEISRLMYVGITRARDFLFFAYYKEDAVKWLENMNVSILSIPIIDIANLDKKEAVAELYALYSKAPARVNSQPLFLNPSKLNEAVDEVSISTNVLPNVHFFPKGINSGFDRMGTCIHNIFAAYDESKSTEQNQQMAAGIIDGNGYHDNLDPVKVIASCEALFAYLKDKYGASTEIKHEFPFMYKLDSGQVVNGEMDMVWKTNDKTVLVDFKNYVGKNEDVTDTSNEKHYVGHYFPQLATYRKALIASGETTEDKLDVVIYYATLGLVVDLAF